MRFERSIDIDAPQQRVWDVVTDLEGWPQHIDTVESIEILTPKPVTTGSRVRLKQPKLSEGVWDVTVWDAPARFEWTQKTGALTSVADHRIEALSDDRTRLTLILDMRGLLVIMVALFYRGLTNDYLTRETQGMKRAAEAT